MLVKQVFSRSMGVWIFAVALLLEEVFCIEVNLSHVNRVYEKVKLMSMEISMCRMKFMRHKQLMGGKPLFLTPKSFIVERINGIERQIKDGLFRSNTMSAHFLDLDYNPLTFSSWDNILPMELKVPEPYHASLVKLVRVQTFDRSLGEVLTELLKPYSGRFKLKHPYFQETEVSRMISLLGKLPVLDKFDREAYLPKETVGVSWTEVTNLVSKMEKILRGFVPTDDVLNKDAVLNEDAVLVNFLKLENGVIDYSIISQVYQLFDNSSFYRLAVSEVHTVYIYDYPEAILYTRFLQETLRKLTRFVNWLEEYLTKRMSFLKEYFPNPEDMGSYIRELDKAKEYLDPSVVYDLKAVLDHGPSGLVPTSALQGRMRLFSKVFAEFEARSHFFTTKYALMKEKISDSSHIIFLVAFTDDIVEKLIQILKSENVKDMCEEYIKEDWETLTCGTLKPYEIDVFGTLDHLCDLRDQALGDSPDAAQVAPYDKDNSFFRHFMKIYPALEGDENGELVLPRKDGPVVGPLKKLFAWENPWATRLEKLNLIISAHKFNIP